MFTALADRLRSLRPTPQVHLLLGLAAPMALLIFNMWRFSPFTVDDSYISFRYARNFAEGHGLVYNPGEYIEGYTNFLFTLLLGLTMKLGADPVLMSKLIGGACACLLLVVVHRFGARLAPYSLAPCVATWLLASSPLCAGYSVFGLETGLFTMLVAAGAYLVYEEEARADARALPLSGLVFAAAGLTRPEAPLFLGLTMLTLGRGFFSRRNIVRGLLFALPVGAHLLWRHAYYGDWVPATLHAKTGDLAQQLAGGRHYLWGYLKFLGPIGLLAPVGLVLALRQRRREALACALICVCFAGYVVLVGGDWMPHHRFFAPIEPFLFLLIGVGARAVIDARRPALLILALALGVGLGIFRSSGLNQAHQRFVIKERGAMQRTVVPATEWLLQQPPGKIAIGDIGYVGYYTNLPLLDILGLVDPVIAKLPGGYARKFGPGFLDRLFSVMPAYILIIASGNCDVPKMLGTVKIFGDKRFWRNYFTAHRINLGGASWCIYEHKKHRAGAGAGPAPEPARVVPRPAASP